MRSSVPSRVTLEPFDPATLEVGGAAEQYLTNCTIFHNHSVAKSVGINNNYIIIDDSIIDLFVVHLILSQLHCVIKSNIIH